MFINLRAFTDPQLKLAVSKISRAQDIVTIVDQFGFEESSSTEPQVLGTYIGSVEGVEIQIIHRWYDRNKPFVILPDGNKVALMIDDKKIVEATFFDDH